MTSHVYKMLLRRSVTAFNVVGTRCCLGGIVLHSAHTDLDVLIVNLGFCLYTSGNLIATSRLSFTCLMAALTDGGAH